MKRSIASALVLGVFCLIGFVGCGDTETKKDAPPATTPPPAGGGADLGKGAAGGGAPDAPK